MAEAAPAPPHPGAQVWAKRRGPSQRLGIALAIVALWFAVASAAGAFESDQAVIHPSRAGPFSASGRQPTLLNDLPFSWLPPQPVDPMDHASDTRNAFLVADARDSAEAVNLHLVWEQDERIRYARHDDRGWQIEELFGPVGDSPAMAIGPDGRLHLVYADVSTDSAQLQVHHCVRDAEGWGLPQVIDDRRLSSDDPSIAVVGDSVHVVWTERLDARNQLVHARSANGGQLWDSVRPIPDAWGYAPALTVAPDGMLWLGWQSEPDARTGQASDIYASRWDGVSWSAPEDISQMPTTYSRAPDLLCTAPDEAHITWEEESADGSLSIYYSVRGTSGWSLPTLLSQGEGRQPSIAHSADARIHVAWDTGQSIRLRTGSGAGDWGAPTTVASAANGVRDVALATDREGRLWAVWSARTGTDAWRLFFSSEAPESTATPSCSPSPTEHPTATASATVTPTHVTPSPPMASATASASNTITEPTWNLTPLSATPGASRCPAIHLPVTLKWASARPDAFPQFPREANAWSAGAHNVRRAGLRSWNWEPPEDVSQSSETGREPALARRWDGQVFAVWVEPYLGYDMLRYSIRAGGIWSRPEIIFEGEEPSLAIGPDGTLHLAYACNLTGNYEIYYTYWMGGRWGPPETVSTTRGSSVQPSLIVKPDGTVIIVWTDTSEGDNRIYYGWRTGGIWSTFIIDGSIDGSAPALAVAAGGDLWAIWQAPEDSGDYDVYATRGDGINWSGMAFDISTSDGVNSIAPQAVGSAQWGAFVVWQEESGTSSDIYYADNLDGPYWSFPENISESTARSEQPVAALDQLGQLHVAWSEAQALSIRSRISPGSAWLPAESLTNGGDGFGEVAMVSDPTRHIHLAWSEPRGAADRDIYYRRGARLPDGTLWLALAGSHWTPSSR